jgi:hypothetical protein
LLELWGWLVKKYEALDQLEKLEQSAAEKLNLKNSSRHDDPDGKEKLKTLKSSESLLKSSELLLKNSESAISLDAAKPGPGPHSGSEKSQKAKAEELADGTKRKLAEGANLAPSDSESSESENSNSENSNSRMFGEALVTDEYIIGANSSTPVNSNTPAATPEVSPQPSPKGDNGSEGNNGPKGKGPKPKVKKHDVGESAHAAGKEDEAKDGNEQPTVSKDGKKKNNSASSSTPSYSTPSCPPPLATLPESAYFLKCSLSYLPRSLLSLASTLFLSLPQFIFITLPVQIFRFSYFLLHTLLYSAIFKKSVF